MLELDLPLLIAVALGVFAGNVATRIAAKYVGMRPVRNFLYRKTGWKLFIVRAE